MRRFRREISRRSMTIPPPFSRARAFAPGSIGNLGPGLDVLGCAITGAGDVVTVSVVPTAGVRIDHPGHVDLSTNPDEHTSGIAAHEVLRRAAATSIGIALSIEKGLPLSGGQGGSAASAIAAAAAVNALLGAPLDANDVLRSALVAEERVAGRHLDNLAPSLLGGIILVRSVEPPDIVRLPTPKTLRVVIVHPDMQLRTADARAVLPQSVPRAIVVAQLASVAAMVAAFSAGDLTRLRGAVEDHIAEPARASLLPGFLEAKAAAMFAGALGCSIAGGGPSSFAFTDGDAIAERVMTAMIAAYRASGMNAAARIAHIDDAGTRVETF
jgi:homoserine kinase